MPQLTPRKHILFIEDSIDYQDLMLEAFERLAIPHHLQIVGTGTEALNLLYPQDPFFQGTYPDLIILDLGLPDICGLEILKIVKNEPLLKWIPCVIFSSSKQASDILKSYSCQANCYIQKPREFEPFLEIVQQMLNFWFKIVVSPSISKDRNIMTRLD